MVRSDHRRFWVVTFCVVFAAALTVQTMMGTAMAGPAPHAMDITAPMADGCTGCGDSGKADGACLTASCAAVMGVLADAPRVAPSPAAAYAQPCEAESAGQTTNPDPLPPRR